MSFRSFNALRVLSVVSQTMSFTQAAHKLHVTKGAVSYQIKQLEEEMGFRVFARTNGRIQLTERGKNLAEIAQHSLTALENEITDLKKEKRPSITIGMSTYFASRWLSPRLMNFTSKHSDIGLRLQPSTGLFDLEEENIDMAIRWGNGNWDDLEIEHLFHCPAIPTAGKYVAEKIRTHGLESMLKVIPLLHDREASDSWREWLDAAEIDYQTTANDLTIPDPNVRVQAVIDDQGLALNDRLVQPEIDGRQLFQVSSISLDQYGYYLAYPRHALKNPHLLGFRQWILSEAKKEEVARPKF
ncbi:MAG: LysR family transcriptional regulator [Gammaproteobacteria bacterium]|nr:LysR family transcriptional regulator [Gammaproteobacteria bacterium]